ncbi:MAG: hypothetical protein B7Y02_05565 [Rhodobacterales bacterium 17-64-5]|nr:MAG: hypothetical protein B7Y02_05565 [Rhodobacterales bacterium 17-64-5]
MPTTPLALTSLRPGGEDALHRYLEVVSPLMQTAGARLINRYEVKRTLSGSDLPEVVSIIEYPDTEAVRRVFEAAEYLALAPVREAAFQRYDICVLED